MKDKENKSIIVRALNSICACVLIVAIIYVLIAGAEKIALLAIAASLVGTATPVVLSAEGTLEIVAGIAEALLEGIMMLIDGVVSAISSILG